MPSKSVSDTSTDAVVRGARRLSAEEARRTLDPATLPFRTTAEVDPLSVTVGQPRALDAIEFGLQAGSRGFNLFVAGPSGTGRENTVLSYMREHAAKRPTPPDWIYVHNFMALDRPVAISLPAGDGRVFEKAMHDLVQTIQREIPRAIEGEEVQDRRDAIVAAANELRTQLFSQLNAFAAQRDYSIELKPTGIVSFPLVGGQPLAPQVFEQLPEESRKAIQQRGEQVQAEVASTMRQVRKLDRETVETLRQLERDVVTFVTGPLFDELRERFGGNEELRTFLDQVQADIPDHLHDFWPQGGQPETGIPAELVATRVSEHLARYDVNVLVDNSETTGAPVVFERNPTFSNLLGRVEFRAVFGAMVTDFRQIKAGALHRANGGFLIVHVLDVLRNPLAWETLKRSLLCEEIEVESLGEHLSIQFAGRLRPEPVPLDVKVVLIGPRNVYQLLFQLDEDFTELFAVRADFAPDMEWNDEHALDYAAFISRKVRENQLLHFDAAAVARVVEYGARLRDHQRKLSTKFLEIANLVTEASHWARKAGRDPVMAEDVERAIEHRTYRANLIEERVQEVIAERTITVDTEGKETGQVNGLSIIDLGDYAFGKPNRISARVSIGQQGVQSIERDIELSGPIHSKGVLILSGYLSGQYGASSPLALNATITFEQTYEEVEGDSASSTELYALLSALSDVPIDQGIAVTGSVDQFGRVQAVGGVTRKVEGFFDACRARGLTGKQGVLVPAANVSHLMLRQDVVDAIAEARFHLWSIDSIDQGIELLTGMPAGDRRDDGTFPDGTVHARVLERLAQFRKVADDVLDARRGRRSKQRFESR
jgi:lon-related putative ATP-dependent protease